VLFARCFTRRLRRVRSAAARYRNRVASGILGRDPRDVERDDASARAIDIDSIVAYDTADCRC
jgi:hypothetical protein